MAADKPPHPLPAVIGRGVRCGRPEVLGRYSNHAELGERIDRLLEIVLPSHNSVKTKTTKQIRKRLRPAEASELVDAYRASETVYQLARQFGIHRNTVSGLLERHGVPRRGRPLSPLQIQLAVELYVVGQSAAVIARQLECDPGTVRLALIKAGVTMRDSHGREK
jgi:transposase-like protein